MTYAIATRRVYNLAPMNGRGAIENIRTVGQKHFTFQANYVSDDANQIMHTEGGGRNSGTFQCTGLRFLFGSGNMVAGSTVSLWGSP